MKYLSTLQPIKNDVKIWPVQWKNVWFCLSFVVWVHFSHKTEKISILKVIEILWYFLIKREMVPDLNMPYGKMSYFVLFPLFGFSSVIKLRNFDFESHWNTLILFDKKNYGVRFEYVLQKDAWFCFISIVWVHFSHKTEKFRFWRSLKYLNIFW